MKRNINWLGLPTSIAAFFLITGVSLAQQVISISPTSQVVTLTGVSGGTKRDKSCAGFVSEIPNYSVRVSKDSNLRFKLECNNDVTLLITGAKGQKFCVQADPSSAGTIELPGRWSQGLYDVYVGSRTQTKAPYKLSIVPNQN